MDVPERSQEHQDEEMSLDLSQESGVMRGFQKGITLYIKFMVGGA